jgi:carbon storage regulator
MLIEGVKDMLILTRRPHQALIIGAEIEIKVLDIIGDRVRIGITAPREMKVLRQELKQDAAAPASP